MGGFLLGLESYRDPLRLILRGFLDLWTPSCGQHQFWVPQPVLRVASVASVARYCLMIVTECGYKAEDNPKI